MNIIGIYNNITENYVKAVIDVLLSEGFVASHMHVDDYDYLHNVDSFPTFMIVKENKAGYPLVGKYSIEFILEWAKNSGATCN
jgi:hypothetical protein